MKSNFYSMVYLLCSCIAIAWWLWLLFFLTSLPSLNSLPPTTFPLSLPPTPSLRPPLHLPSLLCSSPSLPTANAQILSSTLGGRAQFEVKTGQLMGATLYSTGDNFVVSFSVLFTLVLYCNAITFCDWDSFVILPFFGQFKVGKLWTINTSRASTAVSMAMALYWPMSLPTQVR